MAYTERIDVKGKLWTVGVINIQGSTITGMISKIKELGISEGGNRYRAYIWAHGDGSTGNSKDRVYLDATFESETSDRGTLHVFMKYAGNKTYEFFNQSYKQDQSLETNTWYWKNDDSTSWEQITLGELHEVSFRNAYNGDEFVIDDMPNGNGQSFVLTDTLNNEIYAVLKVRQTEHEYIYTAEAVDGGVDKAGGTIITKAFINVTPTTGYKLKKAQILPGGVAEASIEGNTITIENATADFDVVAVCEQNIEGFNFTASRDEHCTVSPTSGKITEDEIVTISVTPETGYVLDSCTEDSGKCTIDVDKLNNRVIIKNATGDLTLHVHTAAAPTEQYWYTSLCTHGTATPSYPTYGTLNSGGTASITVTPAEHYRLTEDGVIVHGGEGTYSPVTVADNTITIANVTGNLFVEIDCEGEFEPIDPSEYVFIFEDHSKLYGCRSGVPHTVEAAEEFSIYSKDFELIFGSDIFE